MNHAIDKTKRNQASAGAPETGRFLFAEVFGNLLTLLYWVAILDSWGQGKRHEQTTEDEDMSILNMSVEEVTVAFENAVKLGLHLTPSRLQELRVQTTRVPATARQHKEMQNLLTKLA